MNRTTSASPGMPSLQDGTPWLLLVFVTVVFALTAHIWGFSAIMDQLPLQWTAETVAQGSQTRRVLYPLLGLYGLGFVFRADRGTVAPRGLLGWVALGFVLLAVVSMFWVDDFAFSLRRIVSFLLFGVAAVGLSSRLTPRNIALLIFVSSAAYLVLGIISEIKFGTFSLFPGTMGYRFAGTWHPNLQGMNCALLCLSSVVLGHKCRPSRQVFYYCATAAGLWFLILTKSRTSFASFIVAILAYGLLMARASKRAQIAFVVFTVVAALFLVAGEETFQAVKGGVLLGRADEGAETLMGRFLIWRDCSSYAADRPLLGYGFNGFWTPQRMEDIAESHHWSVGSGHSMYVDVALDFGLVGLVFFVVILSAALVRARLYFRVSGDVGYAFLHSFIIFYCCHGLLESVFLCPGFFSFIGMLVLAALGFGKKVLAVNLR